MNSYGVQGNGPEWAEWGWYDVQNGEWVGQWFKTRQDAKDEWEREKNKPECKEGDMIIASTSDPLDYIL